MSYTYIDSTRGGDWSDNCAADVYILQSKGAYNGDRSDAADAAVTSLDDSLGYINGYNVHEYTTDCDVSNLFYNSDILNELIDWRKNNGFTNDAVYVLVHRVDSEDPGATYGGVAWKEPTDVHASAEVGNPPRTTSHETAHAHIDGGNCSEVQDLMGNSDSEHALGTERNGKYTPFGGDKWLDKGSCTASSASGDTLLYSYCTRQSMKYTANHVFNGHLEDTC